MKLADIHHALMINTAEKLDEEGLLIPHQARREADELLEGDRVGRPSEAIIARSRALSNYLSVNAPALFKVTEHLSTLTTTVLWGSIILSMCLGFGVHSLGEGRQFHLISPILLSLIAWNLISMMLILWTSRETVHSKEALHNDKSIQLRAPRKKSNSKLSHFVKRAHTWIQLKVSDLSNDSQRQQLSHHLLQRRILTVYLERLWEVTQPQVSAELKRLLHLMSVFFVLGTLLSAYWDGLIYQYQASAESTFLSPERIESLLSLILAPATLFGLGEVNLAGFEVTGKREVLTGEAAIWIHRYALSMICWVVIPRLFLALSETAKVWRISLNLPYQLRWFERVPTLNIGLASHTNVGKTSLARTLLKRDVGLVKDAEHVTRTRACYFLINQPNIRVRLWDTPGFGELNTPLYDSQRSASSSLEVRLEREAYEALGEEADVILYLVAAWPTEREITQVSRELQFLSQHRKPMILIINRINEGEEHSHPSSEPRSKREESCRQWRHILGELFDRGVVSDICVLDAFDRPINDERTLYQVIHNVTSSSLSPLTAAALEEWERGHALLVERLSSCLQHTLLQLLRIEEQMGAKGKKAKEEAVSKLNQRAEEQLDQALNRLLDLFGLVGSMRADVSEAALKITFLKADHKEKRKWGAIWGGAITGLTSGVIADVMAGGLSLGGGMIVGAIMGAIGGAGLVEGYEYLSDGEERVCLSVESITELGRKLLLFTLDASAHGRARGEFQSQTFGGQGRLEDQVDQLEQIDLRCMEVVESLFLQHGDALKQQLVNCRIASTTPPVEPSREALYDRLSSLVQSGLEQI